VPGKTSEQLIDHVEFVTAVSGGSLPAATTDLAGFLAELRLQRRGLRRAQHFVASGFFTGACPRDRRDETQQS
jgi:hypothetical protein